MSAPRKSYKDSVLSSVSTAYQSMPSVRGLFSSQMKTEQSSTQPSFLSRAKATSSATLGSVLALLQTTNAESLQTVRPHAHHHHEGNLRM